MDHFQSAIRRNFEYLKKNGVFKFFERVWSPGETLVVLDLYRMTIKEWLPKNLVVAIIGAINQNLFASAIVPYVYRNANIQ